MLKIQWHNEDMDFNKSLGIIIHLFFLIAGHNEKWFKFKAAVNRS